MKARKQLAAVLDAAQYTSLKGQEVRFGRYVVKVDTYTRSGQSGSWGTGFKFSTMTYGVLTRRHPDKLGWRLYSANHGATWHEQLKMALRAKGKVILKRERRKEFAFDSIQKINRDYYGSSYQWRR
jgi:hypothetical protein